VELLGVERRPQEVGCEQFQDALSARSDGEHCSLDGAGLDRHVARCARCRAFVANVTRLRRMCLHAMPPLPDRTETILAALRRDDTTP
jgi:predicted anti-sigma-YlaC factor YlaD